MGKYLLAMAVMCLSSSALADGHEQMSEEQAAMMAAWEKSMAPGEPHEKLAKATGQWLATTKVWMEPGGEPTEHSMTAQRYMSMDGRVRVDEWEGEFMGKPFSGVAHMGYDNTRELYWTTWFDNMSTTVLTDWGKFEDGTLIMYGKAADPMSGKMMKTRTEIEFPDANTELMRMYQQHGDSMVKTMEIAMRRDD